MERKVEEKRGSYSTDNIMTLKLEEKKTKTL